MPKRSSGPGLLLDVDGVGVARRRPGRSGRPRRVRQQQRDTATRLARMEVEVQRLKEMLDSGEVQLVDTREAYEVEAGHIPGSRHVELNEVSGAADSFDRDSRSSSTAAAASARRCPRRPSAAAGFDAYNLAGGILAWNEAGLPLEPEDGAGGRAARARLMEQRLSLVTLGVADLARARAFYEALGWTTRAAPATTWSSSRPAGWSSRSGTGTSSPRTAASRTRGGWGGVTLAYNVRSPEEVDEVDRAGARRRRRHPARARRDLLGRLLRRLRGPGRAPVGGGAQPALDHPRRRLGQPAVVSWPA